MSDPSRDPSIEHEPHLRRGGFQPDPSEIKAEQIVGSKSPTVDDLVEHSVWDEPGLSPQQRAAKPVGALTYADWLQHRRDETPIEKTWTTTFIVALVAGPLAILGALINSNNGGAFGIAMLTVVGPLSEEVMKTAALVWVVEKRPFLIHSPLQIFVCLAFGAFGFAAIENVMYLYILIPDPDIGITIWRWTVCVAMHVGCTFVCGTGLLHVWRQTTDNFTKPNLASWFPYLLVATAIHGIYNGAAFVYESTRLLF